MKIDQDKTKLSKFLKGKKIEYSLGIVFGEFEKPKLRVEIFRKNRREVKLFCRDEKIEAQFGDLSEAKIF